MILDGAGIRQVVRPGSGVHVGREGVLIMGSQDERETRHWYWGKELDSLIIVPEPDVAPVKIKIIASGEESSGETHWLSIPADKYDAIRKILTEDTPEVPEPTADDTGRVRAAFRVIADCKAQIEAQYERIKSFRSPGR